MCARTSRISPLARNDPSQNTPLIDPQPVGVERRAGVVGQRRAAQAQLAGDVPTEQPDLAACAERPVAEHALIDAQSVGVERRAGVIGQRRVMAVQLAGDVRPEQPDLTTRAALRQNDVSARVQLRCVQRVQRVSVTAGASAL